MDVYRALASPPGKSTRAVPTSGLDNTLVKSSILSAHSQEQAIPSKHGIPDLDAHTIRRVSRQTACESRQRTDIKGVPVVHESIERVL